MHTALCEEVLHVTTCRGPPLQIRAHSRGNKRHYCLTYLDKYLARKVDDSLCMCLTFVKLRDLLKIQNITRRRVQFNTVILRMHFN